MSDLCITHNKSSMPNAYFFMRNEIMDDSEKIAARLRAARLHAGFSSAEEAAASLGIKYPTYAAHENGSRGIGRAQELYARRFKVSLDWLKRGIGAGPGESDGQVIEHIIDVPLLGQISAGVLRLDDFSGQHKGTITVGPLPPGDWLALEVDGDSMDRISPEKSIIILNRRDKRLVPNGCYVIADEDGSATYKRYRPNPDRFEPVSTNPEHEPIFPDQMPPVVGRVHMSILRM